jgi:hypothetical protein
MSRNNKPGLGGVLGAVDNEPKPEPSDSQVLAYIGGGASREHTVTLATRVPESLRQRVRVAAAEDGREIQDMAVEAWENWLAKRQAV